MVHTIDHIAYTWGVSISEEGSVALGCSGLLLLKVSAVWASPGRGLERQDLGLHRDLETAC